MAINLPRYSSKISTIFILPCAGYVYNDGYHQSQYYSLVKFALLIIRNFDYKLLSKISDKKSRYLLSEMSDNDDWDDYDDETPAQQKSTNVSSSDYDNYPHLFLNLGKQKFYTPFLFYAIMIIFMGLMVFKYSVG